MVKIFILVKFNNAIPCYRFYTLIIYIKGKGKKYWSIIKYGLSKTTYLCNI